MKRKHEYHEGLKAHKHFERTMKALFKAPKTVRVGQAAKKKNGQASPSRKFGRKGKGA